MAQKSRELDKKLAEILVPLGFQKIPKTRQFIRLCGDGVFQGVYWYHEPRYHCQELEFWIESAWREPNMLFRPYLTSREYAIMIMSMGCARFEYGDAEYIPVRIYTDSDEEAQLKQLSERILPRFERWKTPRDVFLAHRGGDMAAPEGHQPLPIRYLFGRDYTLCLLLNMQDEAKKYLDAEMAHAENNIEVRRATGEAPRPCDVRELEEWQWKRDHLNTPEAVQEYLQQCREQNLEDYEDLMAGKRGEVLRLD